MHVALDPRINFSYPSHSRIEVRHLEPEQTAVAEGNIRRCKGAVLVLDVDLVQLQDQFPTTDELLVFVASGALSASRICA